MIEVKNLVKEFGPHKAVNDISFTVEKGKIYGFLGPNGAGKSTTMNIITGYTAATSGSVRINGHDIFEEPLEAKKCIGYLPEWPPLYFDMTVAEYMRFAAELKKVPAAERKAQIARIMETCRIADVEDRMIKNLSKGYKQRVGLAQAMLGDPEVLILDEPTVGLDPIQISEIRDVIRSLADKHTVLLSSHILTEISAVCDHIIIIAKGRLLASDTPENLSRLLMGSNQTSLTLRGTESNVRAALSNIPEILDISISPDEENENALQVVLQSKKENDIREKVFYALAEAKCPILHMDSEEMSLEEVFMELTAQPGEAIETTEAKGGK